jgi:hypothetical protein
MKQDLYKILSERYSLVFEEDDINDTEDNSDLFRGLEKFSDEQEKQEWMHGNIPLKDLPVEKRKKYFRGTDLFDDSIPIIKRYLSWKRNSGKVRDAYKVPGTVIVQDVEKWDYEGRTLYGGEVYYKNPEIVWRMPYNEAKDNRYVVSPIIVAKAKKYDVLGIVFTYIDIPANKFGGSSCYIHGKTATDVPLKLSPSGRTYLVVGKDNPPVTFTLI